MADWESAAVAELARLNVTTEGRRDPHATKKRATILALVDARLAGTPEERVWEKPETCSRMIYHTKWKKDVTFAAVLTNVETLARDWKNTETVRSLQEAARRLALAAPLAAAAAIRGLNNLDGNIALRAAFGILDRAGVETAQKGSREVTGKAGAPLMPETPPADLSRLSLDELRNLHTMLEKAHGDPDAD